MHDTNLMQPGHSKHNAEEPKLVHNSQEDPNLMQIDQLHVENGSKLVRYFEELVRDEVSACNSAPELSDSNLRHSDNLIQVKPC